jgi:Zn-dependent alcohol dehydrogenase
VRDDHEHHGRRRRDYGGPFARHQLEIGELRSDELLVRIAASGVCHTDLGVRDIMVATNDFDSIDRAVHDTESGAVIKHVLLMA